MVTHDLDSLFSVCDRIAVLGKKRVLVEGTIKDMLDCPDEWVQSYFRGKRARSIPGLVEEGTKPATTGNENEVKAVT
jgi:phospholipid/cholesterol/gamma-HCH transport system ATP-binding protein